MCSLGRGSVGCVFVDVGGDEVHVGGFVEGGDHLDGVVEKGDDVGEGVSEEAGDADGGVDPGASEFLERDDF